MQIFCFTYAGGTADFYNQLEEYLSSGYDLIKLEYAGHGNRRQEEFYSDFYELAIDLYSVIRNKININEEYALMGYSMGSISVAEVLRLIMEKGELPLPKHIFIAAHEPRTMVEFHDYVGEEIDEYVKERTIQFGGVPDKLINNNSFWRVYLPVFRADYSIIGKYEFNKLNLRTKIPTTVFYSETDTPYSAIESWNQYFVGECEFIKYEGSHFFIRQYCREMTNVIREKLEV